MRLTINLATRRYLNLSRLNASLLVCLALLGALLVFTVRELAYNQAELSGIRRQSALGERPGVAVSEAQLKALAEKIGFANSLIEKKSVNWLKLLDRLEEVVPNGVALTDIAPAQSEQQFKISGSARSFANLRAFMENMEQSENFTEVYLLSQSETKVGLTQQGISFTVTCKVSYR